MAKRLEWVDIAKGIGIFLMVMGHSGIPRSMHDWIYSFHMPFFFILSGYFFVSGKYTLKELVRRKVKTILLPYFFFSIIIDAIRYIGEALALKMPPPISPERILLYGEELGATWFLYVLFLAEVIYFCLCKTIRNNKVLAIFLVILSIVSYIFYKSEIHLPYKVETLGMVLLYFWIGNQMSLLNKRYAWIRDYVQNKKTVLIFVVLFVADIVLANLIVPPLNIRLNILGIYLPSLLLVVIGTLFTIQLSFLLERNILCKRFFQYIGEYSIVLIGFSQIVLQTLKAIFEEAHITGAINAIGRYALLWIILLLLIKVISEYCPIIIGKTKKTTNLV